MTPGASPKSSAFTISRGTKIRLSTAGKSLHRQCCGKCWGNLRENLFAVMITEGRWSSLRHLGRLAQLVRAPALQAGSRGFESLTAHHCFQVLPFTSFQSGFRLRARTPAKRLKFESLTAHHCLQVLPFTSFQSGFRLRARTPCKAAQVRVPHYPHSFNHSLKNSP